LKQVYQICNILLAFGNSGTLSFQKGMVS